MVTLETRRAALKETECVIALAYHAEPFCLDTLKAAIAKREALLSADAELRAWAAEREYEYLHSEEYRRELSIEMEELDAFVTGGGLTKNA